MPGAHLAVADLERLAAEERDHPADRPGEGGARRSASASTFRKRSPATSRSRSAGSTCSAAPSLLDLRHRDALALGRLRALERRHLHALAPREAERRLGGLRPRRRTPAPPAGRAPRSARRPAARRRRAPTPRAAAACRPPSPRRGRAARRRAPSRGRPRAALSAGGTKPAGISSAPISNRRSAMVVCLLPSPRAGERLGCPVLRLARLARGPRRLDRLLALRGRAAAGTRAPRASRGSPSAHSCARARTRPM